MRDGKPKLIEVNPRFWGSLQAAIVAGVDFPYLLYRLVIEGDIKPKLRYRIGCKCSNLLFGELQYLVATMRNNSYSLSLKLQILFDFLKLYKSSYYILSFDDPMPAIFKILKQMRLI